MQGLGIGPDVSHTEDLSLRKTEGSGVGDFKAPPVCVEQLGNGKRGVNINDINFCTLNISLDSVGAGVTNKFGFERIHCDEKNIEEVISWSGSAVQHVVFKCFIAHNVSFTWNTMLISRDKLYIKVPDTLLIKGSKESFVNVLDYAESALKCHHNIVYFKRDRKDMSSVMRLFMYYGFALLKPGHPLIPGASNDIMYMAYSVSDSDDEGKTDDNDSDGAI